VTAVSQRGSKDSGPIKRVVTLIHGTYAKRADWVKDSSPLVRALKKNLEGEVFVKSFGWSGRNLHCSRRSAAKQLREHILTIAKDYPTAEQFIIAHSHGGNVALYALTDPVVRDRVACTICLSTPFILCRKRQFPGNALLLLFGIAGVFCLAYLISLTSPWFTTPSSAFLFMKYVTLPAAALLVCGFALVLQGLLSYLVLRNWTSDIEDVYDALFSSFMLPKLSAVDLLVLRAPRDEASALLIASMFGTLLFEWLSTSLTTVYRFGDWLERKSDQLSRFEVILIGLFITLSGTATFLLSRMGRQPSESQLAIPLSLLGFALLILLLFFAHWVKQALRAVYLILVFPLLVISAILSTPYGFETALLGGLFQFSAEASPPGSFMVTNLQADTAKGLWHSLPYSDKEAFRLIVARINQC